MTRTQEKIRRSTVDPAVLDTLSADPVKRDLYCYDTYVREGLSSFQALTDIRTADEVTFVVLKPDAVAGRRCSRILAALREQGWLPIAATTVRFDPLLTRELWRYQFNAASDQRIAVVDHLLGSGPSLLTLLYDTTRPDWLPASVRLTAAKGAADPHAGRPGDLRTRIGRVNGLFNFVHCADEPADVVRELQLFSYQVGWEWCRAALLAPETPAEDPTAEPLARLERDIPDHDLELSSSLVRLSGGTGPWARLARTCAAPDRIGGWLRELRRTELPAGAGRWDVLTVLTTWIECNADGVAPVLPTLPVTAWQPRERSE